MQTFAPVPPAEQSILAELDAEQATLDCIQKYQNYVNPTQVALLKVGGFDHIEHMAEGVYITDLDGNVYIDCLGGYGVFSLGHRHPRIVQAVKDQLDRMPLSSKTFLNKPLADLAERLASLAPGDLQFTFMCNSGTEAVEGAIKAARMATGRAQIVSAVGGYHGKTLGALSAGGRETYKTPFAPLLADFVQVPWNDIDALRQAVSERTAAVLLEPVQGEGGIRVPSDDYLSAARQISTDSGALLIMDEVQTGLGRTGTMFACEHWRVAPDLMTLAKCLGGGVLPVGAFMGTAHVWDKVFRANPFIHTSTFGGGELACAAGLAALEVTLDEDLPGRARDVGAYFLNSLQSVAAQFPSVLKEARGLGLMLGVEFTDPDIGKLVIGSMVHRGVVAAYTLNNPTVIRFEPPLVITKAQVDTVVDVFAASVQDAIDLLGDLI